MDNERYLEFLICLKKKWYIIFICVIICAGMLILEKNVLAPVTPKTGEMIFTQVIKFSPPITTYKDRNSIKDATMYTIHMWSNMQKFIDSTENDFDYEKFCKDWYKKDYKQKFGWVNSHINMIYVGNDIYEIIFNFSSKDAKDSDYILQNKDGYLRAYKQYVKNALSVTMGNYELETIDKYEYLEPLKVPGKIELGIKYIVIGSMLGLIVGIILVFSIFMVNMKKLNKN